MNNQIIYYGPLERLRSAETPDTDQLRSDKWTGNCYGIEYYAYMTDNPQMDDGLIDELNRKYMYVGGLKQHMASFDFYSKTIKKHFNKIKIFDHEFIESLGINISQLTHQDITNYAGSILQLSVINAAINTIKYDTSNPHSNIFLVNVEKYDVTDFKYFYEIGAQQLIDYKKRKSSGFLTTGGDPGIDVSPVNGSTTVYASEDYGLMATQSHPLQQFCSQQVFKQMLFNINFGSSSFYNMPRDVIDAILKTLGMSVVLLDDFSPQSGQDIYKALEEDE